MLSIIKAYLPKEFKRVSRQYLQNVRETVQYRRMQTAGSIDHLQHVVFVCKGNICRSAFAEHLFRQVVHDRIAVESCGIEATVGSRAPKAAVFAAERFGVNLQTHRAKKLEGCSLKKADLILPMEFKQYRHLLEAFPEMQARVRLLNDFSAGAPWKFCNIYDPYGRSDKDFRSCFAQISAALWGLKKRCRRPDA